VLPPLPPTVEVGMPLVALLEPRVLEVLVRGARLTGVVRHRRLDADDVAALRPDGVLVLHLTKDSYERAGLPGHRCPVSLGAHRYGACCPAAACS
jgi:hypothetical protein